MYIGVDLGGTKIAVAVVDPLAGAIVSRDVIPTDSEAGPAAVLERMAQLIRSVCGMAGVALPTIQAIGVGVPGVFDPQRGSGDRCESELRSVWEAEIFAGSRA